MAETNIKNLKENIMPMLINKLYSEKRVNPHKCGHWKEHLPLNTGQTVPNTDKTPAPTARGVFKLGPIGPNSKISIDWLVGMVDGDGSFFITIAKSDD